ncbi:MAG TPA: hypothetical protein VK074_05125 [Fodinibius sp.]|nr:hypothetical protein [Fodinibius sp.]
MIVFLPWWKRWVALFARSYPLPGLPGTVYQLPPHGERLWQAFFPAGTNAARKHPPAGPWGHRPGYGYQGYGRSLVIGSIVLGIGWPGQVRQDCAG